jgi:pyridoxine 5-phosphate synthase
VRNTRHLGIPSVVARRHAVPAGRRARHHRASAARRAPHPRATTSRAHALLAKDWPGAEFNIEGNPFHNLMDFVRELRPHQATFVPDSEGQFTSDHGWDLPGRRRAPAPADRRGPALGVRVSLFMDPIPSDGRWPRPSAPTASSSTPRGYAGAWGTPAEAGQCCALRRTARAALAAGLGVNAGHDLNRDNLTAFLRAVPGVQEVSIGHAFIADALELGYAATTRPTWPASRGAPEGRRRRDLRHRHRHLRRAPHPRVAGAAWRALRPQDPERRRVRHLARAQRALARARRALPGHALLRQGGLQQGHRHGHAHAHDLALCEIAKLPSGKPVIVLHGELKAGSRRRASRRTSPSPTKPTTRRASWWWKERPRIP